MSDLDALLVEIRDAKSGTIVAMRAMHDALGAACDMRAETMKEHGSRAAEHFALAVVNLSCAAERVERMKRDAP